MNKFHEWIIGLVFVFGLLAFAFWNLDNSINRSFDISDTHFNTEFDKWHQEIELLTFQTKIETDHMVGETITLRRNIEKLEKLVDSLK